MYGYKEQQEARSRVRPIHRYNRFERFKNTLEDLLGVRGKVPEKVLALIPTDCDWEIVRRILKENKAIRYYNQIPHIIYVKTGIQVVKFHDRHLSYKEILKKFNEMTFRFESTGIRKKYKRKYFPNLRFVALTLIEEYGGEFSITIPFIRTPRKVNVLNKILIDCLY
jgi:hypothetical protein